MLFNGDSYECKYDATNGYQIFGYYDGSSWHEGKPIRSFLNNKDRKYNDDKNKDFNDMDRIALKPCIM